MAYVVCEPCRDCKYTDCVVVCPCDCFYQDDMMLYIDPADCIDCEACVPECPVEAIFHDSNVPAQWQQFVQLNAERAECSKPRARTSVNVSRQKKGRHADHQADSHREVLEGVAVEFDAQPRSARQVQVALRVRP